MPCQYALSIYLLVLSTPTLNPRSQHTLSPTLYQPPFHPHSQYTLTTHAIIDTLQVDRIGPMHQAGSDSLLTAQTFFSLLSKHLQGTTQSD